jgi:uncharacterized phiE125 gp8 family phage protein
VEEAKLHLRVAHNDDDNLIYGLVSAATEFAQEKSKRQFITATYDLKIDYFPPGDEYFLDSAGIGYLGQEIILPRPPLASVTSITYVDPAGATQTLSPSVYTVDISESPGRIRLAYGQSWPSTLDHPGSVTVRYVCGYGGPSSVPSSAKAAMLLYVGHLYENRELAITGTIITKVPLAFESLIASLASPTLI